MGDLVLLHGCKSMRRILLHLLRIVYRVDTHGSVKLIMQLLQSTVHVFYYVGCNAFLKAAMSFVCVYVLLLNKINKVTLAFAVERTRYAAASLCV